MRWGDVKYTECLVGAVAYSGDHTIGRLSGETVLLSSGPVDKYPRVNTGQGGLYPNNNFFKPFFGLQHAIPHHATDRLRPLPYALSRCHTRIQAVAQRCASSERPNVTRRDKMLLSALRLDRLGFPHSHILHRVYPVLWEQSLDTLETAQTLED